MKNNKYFTPDIEDMFVSCEFEMHDTWGGWKKLILTEDLLKNPMVGLGSGNERVPWYWKFKVPYLTKEQIEAEGWKHIGGKLLSVAEQHYVKSTYRVSYSIDSKKIKFFIADPDEIINYEDECIFNGECKCINQFRLITKLLCII